MKTKALALVVSVFLLLSSFACSTDAAAQVPPMPAAAQVPPMPAASSAEAQQSQMAEEEKIASASAEELRALIQTYQSSGDDANVHRAAKRLIELVPDDTQAYQDAIAALLSSISADYEEIQSLITQGIKQAPETASDLTHWASAQNQTFSFTVPFIGDYASEAEINTLGITSDNLTNTEILGDGLWQNGIFTTQGNWIYFMLPAQDYYVYKMRMDGTGFTKVGDARGDNLNVVGDWLYYRNLSESDMVYRIRTDGTQKEGQIFNKAVMMSVTKDWIYYNDGGLFKTRPDGSETVQLLNSPCEYMAVIDNWIYFCTGGNRSEFCRISIDGGEPQKLIDGWVSHFLVWDGWMYYRSADMNAICKMRPDGSEQTEIYRSDYMISFFSVVDGKLVVTLCKSTDERGKPTPTEIDLLNLEDLSVLKTIDRSVGVIYTAGDCFYYRDDKENWLALNATTLEETVLPVPLGAEPAQAENKPAASNGNTAANLAMDTDEVTSGTLAQEGDTLYWSNPNDDSQLYFASQNGDSGFEKLVDAHATALNVVNGTLYYCNKLDNFSIHSVSTDGTNDRKLCSDACRELCYSDGWLIYVTESGVSRMSADGSDQPMELVPGKLRHVFANLGWVYFMEDNQGGGLWRIPIDGGERQALLTDHHTLQYSIQDDQLYCLIDGGDSMDVIRMNLDGSDQTEVYASTEKIHSINTCGSRLLVVQSSSDGKHNRIIVQDVPSGSQAMIIDGLANSCVYCFGSDVFYFGDGGLVRQNLDNGTYTIIAKFK